MSSGSIKHRIAALLQMTTAAGCTEAEALAAAEKAAALMRDHGLSVEDITIGQASVATATKGRGVRDPLWGIVAYCTNTAATYSHATGARGADLVFVGREPGPQIAAYLVAVLSNALDSALAEFKAGSFFRRRKTAATRKAAVHDFSAGMVARLSRRLIEIFGPSIDKSANAAARAARDERFHGAVSIKARAEGKPRFENATHSGWLAGGKVNLTHGVNGGSAASRQIGRG